MNNRTFHKCLHVLLLTVSFLTIGNLRAGQEEYTDDSSDWSYQVQGGLEIQLTRSIWSQVGWRCLKYDYNQSGFTNNLALNGPLVQLGVNF